MMMKFTHLPIQPLQENGQHKKSFRRGNFQRGSKNRLNHIDCGSLTSILLVLLCGRSSLWETVHLNLNFLTFEVPFAQYDNRETVERVLKVSIHSHSTLMRLRESDCQNLRCVLKECMR